MDFAKSGGPWKNKAHTVEPNHHLSSKWYRICDLYRNLEALTKLPREFRLEPFPGFPAMLANLISSLNTKWRHNVLKGKKSNTERKGC